MKSRWSSKDVEVEDVVVVAAAAAPPRNVHDREAAVVVDQSLTYQKTKMKTQVTTVQVHARRSSLSLKRLLKDQLHKSKSKKSPRVVSLRLKRMQNNPSSRKTVHIKA